MKQLDVEYYIHYDKFVQHIRAHYVPLLHKVAT